jgi:hypothetical protein
MKNQIVGVVGPAPLPPRCEPDMHNSKEKGEALKYILRRKYINFKYALSQAQALEKERKICYPECYEVMRLGNEEYGIQMYVCPHDGRVVYVRRVR